MEQKTASQPIKTFQSKYLLDTNFFINLEGFYPHDIFRSLDATIKKNIELKNIQTIEAIYNEDKKGLVDKMLNRYSLKKDILVLDNTSELISNVSDYVDERITKLSEHYINKKLKELDKKRNNFNAGTKEDIEREIKENIKEQNKDFLGSAEEDSTEEDSTEEGSAEEVLGPDGLLIAKAMDMGITVVTEEKAKDPLAKDIKIPNVCERFNVKCINFLELLRTEKVQF